MVVHGAFVSLGGQTPYLLAFPDSIGGIKLESRSWIPQMHLKIIIVVILKNRHCQTYHNYHITIISQHDDLRFKTFKLNRQSVESFCRCVAPVGDPALRGEGSAHPTGGVASPMPSMRRCCVFTVGGVQPAKRRTVMNSERA